jgi:hypothetical protein
LQGSDLLAYGNDKEQYQVFVPDFLLGQYADHTWFPPDTAEKGQAMGAFFQGPANPVTTVQKIPGLVKTISESSSGSIESWAILGKCWGGKVIRNSRRPSYDIGFLLTFFDRLCRSLAVTAHPSRLLLKFTLQ